METEIRKNALLDELFAITQDQGSTANPEIKSAFETGTAFREAYNALDANQGNKDFGLWKEAIERVQAAVREGGVSADAAKERLGEIVKGMGAKPEKGDATSDALSTPNPVNQTLDTLKGKLAQLEQAIADLEKKGSGKEPQPNQSQQAATAGLSQPTPQPTPAPTPAPTPGVSGQQNTTPTTPPNPQPSQPSPPVQGEKRNERGGLGAHHGIDRILAEVAKKQSPDWEKLSAVDQEARIEETKAGFNAGMTESKPWEQRLVALQMAGADHDTIQRAWGHEQKREGVEARKEWEQAKGERTGAAMKWASHVTGIPTFARLHEMWRDFSKPNQRMREAEKEMAKAESGEMPEVPGLFNRERKESAIDGLKGEGKGAAAEVGLGGQQVASGDGNSVFEQILSTLKEVLVAIKGIGSGSISGGNPHSPGPQPDGSFIPGGPTPMGKRESHAMPEKDGGRNAMPSVRDNPAASPGSEAVTRHILAGGR